jgi:hypothetical protein
VVGRRRRGYVVADAAVGPGSVVAEVLSQLCAEFQLCGARGELLVHCGASVAGNEFLAYGSNGDPVWKLYHLGYT